MKILFVLGLEVNPKIGGIERVTHVLTEYFMSNGIEVNFLYFRIKEISFPEYNAAVKTFFLPDIVKTNSSSNVEYLQKIIQGNQIDIAINQGNIADCVSVLIAQAVRNSKCRIISILHVSPLSFRQFYGQFKQTEIQYLQTQKKTLKNKIKKTLLPLFVVKEYFAVYKKYYEISVQSSHRFVLLSKGYIPLLNKTVKIKDPDKIIAIANPSSFKEEFLPEMISKKKQQIIYVGRLDYNQKRIDRLLDVWSIIENDYPGWQLIIVGGSVDTGRSDKVDYQASELARLKLISQHLNLRNVTFAGNRDPIPYYKESSLICLTSSYEGFPMVLVEAIQYGVVPVVFGSFEAIYDLVQHNENGMIATPFNLAEYAQCLSMMMQNKSKRELMAKQAINTSKKYTTAVIGNRWVEVFNEITL